MKKRTFSFLIALLFSAGIMFAAAGDATFTLNAHVRGITIHGFVETLPEDNSYDAEHIVDLLFSQGEYDALDGPTDPIIKAQDLTLGYEDIHDFDFGDDEYEEVAYYLFLSNMTSALKVSFTISDFILQNNTEEPITVSWKLGVDTVASGALTISEGKKVSGGTAHLIAEANSSSEIRWGILELSLHFADAVGYVSGDYTATVIANITAS